jgi:hypothetical protein
MTAVEVKRRVSEGLTRRGERVWLCAAAAGATSYSITEALGEADLPATNTKFPGIPTLRAKEHQAEQVDSAKPGFAYEVTIRYEPSTGFNPNQEGPDDPTDPGFTQVDVDFVPTIQDAWRSDGFTQLPQPNQASGTIIDIGGNPVDSAGEPTSIVRILGSVVIGYTITGYPDYSTLLEMAGARNNQPFLGAQIGQILFKHCTSRRVGVNTYQLTYTFAHDDWFHLVQVPKRNTDGIIEVTDGTPAYATTVYWKQPFRKYDDLNSLVGLPL